jgi:transcriptional regulator with XRE-family HTH domain
MSQHQGFAASLRWWRRHRGLSQLDLAGRAEVSQRHLGFMELGRASPSRDMVMRLAAALDVPLRQHNALLVAAGFAPVWRQTNLAAHLARGDLIGIERSPLNRKTQATFSGHRAGACRD